MSCQLGPSACDMKKKKSAFPLRILKKNGFLFGKDTIFTAKYTISQAKNIFGAWRINFWPRKTQFLHPNFWIGQK